VASATRFFTIAEAIDFAAFVIAEAITFAAFAAAHLT
jgi:hypothetical protein